jgi:RNA polymerase sigma-70 factor (ECF subfamily)
MPAPDLFNEDILLLQIAEGNQHAFARLFDCYHQQLGTYIFRLTDSMELAEEVVQDVFLKIWTNRTELAQIRNFRAYLFVISKNHALNCIKKVIRQQKYQQQWEEELAAEEEFAMPDAVDNKYYNLLDTAINNLPPQQQKVYLLSRHERLKYTEIAEEMNISRETVKKYLQHAVAFISTYCERNSDIVMFLILFLNFFKKV